MRYMLLGLLLGGCAPSLVSSNEAGGIMSLRGTMNGQKQAMVAADAQCRKFGKIAAPGSINEIRGTMRYECVRPKPAG